MRIYFQHLTGYMRLKNFVAAVSFCFVFIPPALTARAEDIAAASPAKSGIEFYFAGEYARAITQLATEATPAAPWHRDNKGFMEHTPRDDTADAACLLGDLYALGLGTPRDMRAAAKWWFPPEKQHDALLDAAEKGDVRAQTELGDLYLALPCTMTVDPVTRQITSDRSLLYQLGLEWFAKAAAAGDVAGAMKAGKLVGARYDQPPAQQKALQGWYRIAADSGLAEGQYRYGLALRDAGEYAEGLRWIRMAEAQGHADAKKYLEEGRGREIRTSGGFEMVVVLLAMAALMIGVFIRRKKQPLRAYLTRRNAVKFILYIVILAASLLTIATTPELSRIFDRIFMWLMHARTYLPDAVADNVYIFVTAVFLALIALILSVARFKRIFFSSIMRAMDTEPERQKPADDKKPE